MSRIPKTPRLVLGPIDEKQVPVLEYREPFTFDCFDGDWCARNRVNSSTGRLEAKHGGKIRFGDGFFCHTFAGLVPPDKYFKEHPEYFSLVSGKRQDGYAQLCCTNEDVIRLCTEGILQRHAGPSRGVRVLRLAERHGQALRVRPVPGAGQAGGFADGAGAGAGQPRGRGGREGVSRQGRRDAGLPVDAPAAEDDAAAAQRDHPAVLDRVLLLASAGQVRQPGQPGRSARTWRAGPRSPTGSGSGTT